MKSAVLPRMTSEVLDDYIAVWVGAFLTAKRAAGLSRNTVLYYTRQLRQFETYCDAQAVRQIAQVTPSFIREWLLYLEQGHNAGGRHAAFRALRAFLLWYEHETDEVTSIRKVQPPRVSLEPLQGVSLSDVLAMVSVADTRDAAILLCLLDTGCRAREFLGINLGDVDQATGEILVRQSKGQRPRHVYLGQTARKALRRYLKHRKDNSPALWVSRHGDRLAYSSLRGMVVRLFIRALGGFQRTPRADVTCEPRFSL
jgi:integrase/recombinase XerD